MIEDIIAKQWVLGRPENPLGTAIIYSQSGTWTHSALVLCGQTWKHIVHVPRHTGRSWIELGYHHEYDIIDIGANQTQLDIGYASDAYVALVREKNINEQDNLNA